jgi:AcrR family transcriptional regulator
MPARRGLDQAAVVAAAADLADREGIEALTLTRLAAHLEVRPPSLYAHVDGLDDLRRLLALQTLHELAATLSAATHATRILRSTLHGFTTLEQSTAFALPIPLEDTFDHLLTLLSAGITQWPTTAGRQTPPA